MSKIEYEFNIVGSVEQYILERFRAIVFDTWSRLSIYTPFLTGRAKANWRTSLNEYSHFAGERFSSQPMGTQDQGESQAEMIRVMAALTINDTVFIVNNVPYIGRIETGWPGNPPHPGYFVVERTVNEVSHKYANG